MLRCSATSWDLDGPGFRRTKEWTNHLIHSFAPGILWDDYGIVADVIISIPPFFVITGVY
jgi:hypothetical protein